MGLSRPCGGPGHVMGAGGARKGGGRGGGRALTHLLRGGGVIVGKRDVLDPQHLFLRRQDAIPHARRA